MRVTAALVALSIILGGATVAMAGAEAEDADARRLLAAQLLDAMQVRQSVERSFAVVRQTIPQQLAKLQSSMGHTPDPHETDETMLMLELIAEEVQWERIESDYVGLYAETFSVDEMQAMIVFYQSPAGQALINKQPLLMEKSMELNQKLMLRVMPRLQERLQAPAAAVATNSPTERRDPDLPEEPMP